MRPKDSRHETKRHEAGLSLITGSAAVIDRASLDSVPEKTVSKISFPVKCDYKGGIAALGQHGKHFWIKDGKIGHGEFSLSHSISLDEVAGAEVNERQVGGSDEQTLVASGVSPGIAYRPGGRPASRPKQITEITVRTKDGQAGLWVVERRGGDWVRSKLAQPLKEAGIPI